MEHIIGFYIPIVDGPSVDDLTHAADALYRADHPRKPSCAEINAAAIARGEHPPYKDDDDEQLRYVTLAMTQLRFAYKVHQEETLQSLCHKNRPRRRLLYYLLQANFYLQA